MALGRFVLGSSTRVASLVVMSLSRRIASLSALRSLARIRCWVAAQMAGRPAAVACRFVAGACAGDGVVVVVDGVEHGDDVCGAQPVDAQIAEVWDEVEADVCLVGAAGARS
jgi:hypothetical protein